MFLYDGIKILKILKVNKKYCVNNNFNDINSFVVLLYIYVL